MAQTESEERILQLQSGMARLSARFVQTLPEHVDAFDELWELLSEPEAVNSSIHEISKRAHKLHGQAGSFGFPRIGALAAQVEKEADSLLNDGRKIETDLLEELMAALLDEIEDKIEAA